ncbi:MAG: SecD/SecF/SecDF export membrane protein [archaeon GW2011_AR20]|nr:MAG: SecD/SecF/SecDF export membrane protein [archaeon GW2011_AR20]
MNLKKLLKFRVLFLLFWILVSIIAINPKFNAQGVAIKGIENNSTAALAGMTYDSSRTPTNLEKIIAINNEEVKNIQDYNNILSKIGNSEVIRVKTDKNEYVMIKTEDLGIDISEVQKNNLRKGLDLQGGTRVVLEPQEKLTDQEVQDLISTMENRLNVYGLSDLKIRQSKDLSGNTFIVVEIAGASQEEVRELIAGEGKFEAKIGNDVVFAGGKKDVTFVCREDGTCSGIRQCSEFEGGYQCTFEFQIKLSQEAARKHAEVTSKLDANLSATGGYLSKPLDLYLDGILVDSLQISSSLKGQAATDIAISGPGIGSNRDNAIEDATKNMNKLQTVLITGSLPTKLNIVKIDTISPILGKAFFNNAFTVIIAAIIAVSLVVFIRYRDLKISLPIILISLSEIFITLGIAAIIKYNLDIAAIAGIIAAVGTGVTDQIIISDEIIKGKKEQATNFKDRIKRAFFVILVSWGAGVASMIPLLWAGAGLFTGFALTTIIGVSVGVFITRPAFAAIVENLEEN